MDGLNQRIDEYREFARVTSAAFSKANPKLPINFRRTIAGITREMSELSDRCSKLKASDPLPELCRQAMRLVDADDKEKKNKLTPLSKEVLSMAEPRRDIIGSFRACAKRLRDHAGMNCVTDPEARELAVELRRHAGNVLRNRYYIEDDWRGEKHKIPPYWLGPRPFQ